MSTIQSVTRPIRALSAPLGLLVSLLAAALPTPAARAGALADTTPPTVSIGSLYAGTVGGVVQVRLTATDDVAVTNVTLLLDGTTVGSDPTAPYVVNWNTTTAANGPHSLVARASDGAGNLGSDTLDVTVQNPAFVNEVVVPGITTGLTMAFLPDGHMIVGELTEKIWVVHPGASAPDPKPFLDLKPVGLQGEQGLQELIVDPDFATNQWYYVYYTHTSPSGNYNRVSRFTASGDTTLAGSEVVLWEDDNSANLEHHGGGMAILPGGKLFFTVGEAFFPDDAQRLDSYRGKLLRINLDGSIPTDNPFYDGAGPHRDEIYAYGLRNPTRMFYDAPTGRLFISDVGGNDANVAREEIDLAVAGANYGWPLCEGSCNTAGVTDPLYSYSHLDAFGGPRDAAVMAGFVYRGGTFPSEYQGSFFFGDYSQNWIKRLTFDGSGNLLGVVPFEPPDGSADGPYGDIVKLVQGPDGAVYYVDIGFDAQHEPNGAAIRRIRYVTNDLPPVAAASGNPTTGPAPLTVAFSSAGSFDPEGNPLSYDWDFGDGSSSSVADPSHTYTTNGMYTVRLRVSDGATWTLASAFVVTVGVPPTVLILGPANGYRFRAGEVIPYFGRAFSASGHVLPASAYRWDILFHHEGHIHPGAGPFLGVTTGAFTIPISGHDFSGNTNYEIIVTVTDSTGLQASKSVTIVPDKVNLTFTTQPPGLAIDVADIRVATPFVLDAVKGFHYTIQAPAQTSGGWVYSFVSWSDLGAETHEIVVPDLDSSWVATFAPSVAYAGLVASYNFEEGAGTTAADRSGHGNNGTLLGASWTAQGRYGGALSFDGVAASVTVPQSASVALDSALTLEAWVYPQGATDGWRDVIMKQGDDYFLAPQGGTPALGSTGLGSPLFAASQLPFDTWTFLAATYDGAAMRLYVNGVEAASRAQSGVLPQSGGPLSFGGDALFGQHFSGRIDEIRIYDRALTAGEVQKDMVAPVTGVAAESPSPSPPRASALVSAAPNPFTPRTRIHFRLAAASTPRLRIFDIAGRLVRDFGLPHLAAGEHSVEWDGTGDGGRRLGSGVYVARLEAPDGARAMRIVLVR